MPILLPATTPCAAESEPSLLERARHQLRASGYPCLCRLDCRVNEGIVELRGHVPSYYLKQLAQSLVLTLSVGQEVRNHLQVQ